MTAQHRAYYREDMQDYRDRREPKRVWRHPIAVKFLGPRKTCSVKNHVMNRLHTLLLALFLICSCAWAGEKPDAPKPKTDRVMDRRYFAVLGVLAAAKAADGFTTSEAAWPGSGKQIQS